MKKHYSYLSSFALTDQGLKRKNNEDAFAVFPEHGIFCVADGMGGAEDGEIASKAAIDALSDMLKQFDPEKPLCIKAMQAWLCHALNEASYWMSNQTLQFGKKCMGTTIAGVCFNPESPNVAMAFHAGDSRVYHFHKGSIKQITLDHNFANATGMADENELSPQYRNVILRAVGLEETVDIEMTEFKVEQGDTIIVCSDGLTKMVSDRRIEDIIASSLTVESTTRVLVEEALKNGGRDNITVVAVSMGQLPEPLTSELLTMRMPPIVQRAKKSSSTNNSSGTPDRDQQPIPQKECMCVTPNADLPVPSTTCEKKRTATFLNDLSRKPLKTIGLLLVGIVVIRAGFLLYGDGNIKSASSSRGQPVRIALEATNNVEKAAQIEAAEKRKKDEEDRRAEAERTAKREEIRKTEENAARIAAEEKRIKDEENRKAEADRAAKLEEKRKTEENAARLAAEEKRMKDEQNRKADADRAAKLEQKRKTEENAARIAADEKRIKEENRKAEAKRMAMLEEKRIAQEHAARLAAEMKSKTEKQNGEWESVVQLMTLLEKNTEVSSYFHFMGSNMDPRKVSECIEQYDEVRGLLVGWSTPTKESLPEYVGEIKVFVNVLHAFVNTKAVQRQINEMNKDGSGVDNESRKTWEGLLNEAQKIADLNMEEGCNRKRLVAFVYAIAKHAPPS